MPDDIIVTASHVEQLLSNTMVAERFFDAVSGGDTPELVCEDWGIPLKLFMAWVRGSEDRKARLSEANQAREDLLRQRVQREWSDVGFSDIRQLYDQSGNLLPVTRWPRSLAKSVSSIQIDEIMVAADESGPAGVEKVIRKYKLWDKLRATELLAKSLGMLGDNVRVSGSITLEHALAQSWQKSGAENEPKKIEPGFSPDTPPAK